MKKFVYISLCLSIIIIILIICYFYKDNTMNCWYIMTYNDNQNSAITMDEYGLGKEMSNIVKSIIPNLKEGNKYRTAKISDIPERFRPKYGLQGQLINKNNVVEIELDKDSTEKIQNKTITRTKFVFTSSLGNIKIKISKKSTINLFMIPLLIDRHITILNGQEIEKEWHFLFFKKTEKYLVYEFSDGYTSYFNLKTGEFKQTNNKQNLYHSITANLKFKF